MVKKNPFKRLYTLLCKKRPVFWIALISIVLLLGGSKKLYEVIMGSQPPVVLPLQVQTVFVRQMPMPVYIQTIGTLTAKTELKIKAGGSGRVQNLLVESGSWVETNTLLAHIIAAPEIRAPFDGYLTDWLVKPGEYVTAGTELVDLVNTDLLSLTYRVPEQFASVVDVGQTVKVSVNAYPTLIFEGAVRFISPIVDKRTHTNMIRAEVNNPTQNLWPGMSAHVQQILKIYPDALVVPEAALILTMEGYEVLIVQDGKIQKRKVTIGERVKGRVHVLSGLHNGEAVIIARTNLIEEGANAVANPWTGDW